jgi:hypothetical protein
MANPQIKLLCILFIICSSNIQSGKTVSEQGKLLKTNGNSLTLDSNELSVHYVTKDADIMIFSKVYCDELPYFGNCFSPSKSEIDTCEKYIRKTIKYFGTSNGKHSIKKHGWDTIYRDLKLFRRQYLGFINGEKDSILKVIAIKNTQMDSCPMWGKKFYFYKKYGQNIRWEISYSLKKKMIMEIGGT